MREPVSWNESGSLDFDEQEELAALAAMGPSAASNFEKYAVAVIIVFGALIIAGLMGASFAFGRKTVFFLSLGSATLAYIAGHALLLDKPRFYAIFVGLAVIMAVGAAITLAN